MGVDLRQSLKMSQQLLMTPQLQQAIKLLQLSRMELEQFVTSQLAENPVLEELVGESAEEEGNSAREREHSAEEANNERMGSVAEIVDPVGENDQANVDWEQMTRAQESLHSLRSLTQRADDEDNINYENIVTKPLTLQEHLMGQIGEQEFSDEELRIAQLLIGNVDEKGYLGISVEELAEQESLETEDIEDILDTVQRLDPPGVLARDLKECLLLQVRQHRLKNGIVERIIEKHMKELETRNFSVIAKSLGISIDQVIENVQIIGDLEPVPGRPFGGEKTQIAIPDVYVFKLADEWVITLNDEGLPRLQVSELYKEMIDHQPKDSEEKNYLQDKIKSALWLIKSIQQRQKTIYKVTESILERQKDFFEKGVEYLKPMILKDIAEDIEMHESTISRVTSNKYLHSPRGIFELKYFFNSSVARSDGQNVASESVKNMISAIIKGEDTKKPYSDQKIVEMLEEKGIQLARRTVAKYREQLGVLPSSKRKRYF